MYCLEADRIVRRYPGGVTALSDLSITVPQGGVFGLLGPNGSGKSTFLRIVIDLVRPNSGSIRLFGRERSAAAIRRVGAFIEGARFPPYLTAAEVLDWVALIGGHSPGGTTGLLRRVSLGDAANRKVEGFSLGMKQRLGIAAAMVGEPELIILDEPTNGLDPPGIMDIRKLVRDIAARDGRTVLLSSHLLDEVERTCDRIAILDRGRLVAEGDMSEMLSGHGKLRIRATPLQAALAVAGARGRVVGDALYVAISENEAPQLIASLCSSGISVFEAAWQREDLESIFLRKVSG